MQMRFSIQEFSWNWSSILFHVFSLIVLTPDSFQTFEVTPYCFITVRTFSLEANPTEILAVDFQMFFCLYFLF